MLFLWSEKNCVPFSIVNWYADICPFVSNPDQLDTDPCLLDSDGDGVEDEQDNCPGVANPGQEAHNNGQGQACHIVAGE